MNKNEDNKVQEISDELLKLKEKNASQHQDCLEKISKVKQQLEDREKQMKVLEIESQ